MVPHTSLKLIQIKKSMTRFCQKKGNKLTDTVPCLGYLVDATYEAFTVNTTAFIKFLAA